MLCILTRLPVKSVVRFKSVCKPWRELFHTPEFVKMHQGQFSSDPKNQSVIFYEANKSSMCVLNIIESTGKNKPTASKTILNRETHSLNIIGCCNGLICLGAVFEHRIILCNPALKLYRFIRPPKVDFVYPDLVSLGFGYDANVDDFKVARIVYVENEGSEVDMDISGAEVYSANSDSWTTIELGFQFRVFRPFSDLIVNGNPFWVASVKDKDEVLVCFDVRKMGFKIVPMPAFDLDHSDGRVELVDWKGNLGALLCDKDESQLCSSLSVWVLDDGEGIWRKIHTLGPIQGSVVRFTVCLNNGKLLGKGPEERYPTKGGSRRKWSHLRFSNIFRNGKMIVFDLDNGCVEEIVIDEGQKHLLKIFGYTESLTHVKGMVKEEDERESGI